MLIYFKHSLKFFLNTALNMVSLSLIVSMSFSKILFLTEICIGYSLLENTVLRLIKFVKTFFNVLIFSLIFNFLKPAIQVLNSCFLASSSLPFNIGSTSFSNFSIGLYSNSILGS